ncbi:hypothetical protein CSB45_00280 [candidate division KSB3 bacterium]|uniref:SnoaL-like domain-containing protein n=1 Tax=candidate division KSB3 bacterium TaxID=2044937 RepID=A0A2G6EEG4_9BACT|nr:MAG: hypothetical protein CSB45_00280 [candidate division KSB3 bacterium]PIE28381.1 MAG: hypothetical protein CSA57_14130 [candidate division KSB3 bacterium]
MVKTKGLSLLLALILLVGAVLYFFPTDTKRIKKQFKALEQWAAKDGEEGQLVLGRKVRKLRELLSGSIQVTASVYDVNGRYDADEAAQQATFGRSRYAKIELKFYDLEIDILDEQSAAVLTTGLLTGRSADGAKISETHEVKCLLKKVDGQWLLSQVSVVDVLSVKRLQRLVQYHQGCAAKEFRSVMLMSSPSF